MGNSQNCIKTNSPEPDLSVSNSERSNQDEGTHQCGEVFKCDRLKFQVCSIFCCRFLCVCLLLLLVFRLCRVDGILDGQAEVAHGQAVEVVGRAVEVVGRAVVDGQAVAAAAAVRFH